MADEKLTIPPPPDPIMDPTVATPQPAPAFADPAPAFKADDFLASRTSKAARDEPIRSAPPQIIKRGGIGFFTAFLMSTVAAVAGAGIGAYLALFAGSRPDLVQKAGIAGFVPQPLPVASDGVRAGNIEPLLARVSAIEAELLTLKTRLDGTTAPLNDAPKSNTAANPQPNTALGGVQPPTTTAIAPPTTTLADVGVMKGELAGISGRITAIETRLAALDPTGAGGAIVAGLQGDIAGLKAIVATLQQQAAAAPSPAITFAVVNLAQAANRPGPFMVELDALRAAMPNAPEVAALEPFARTGVPTRELLQERFIGLGPALAASQVAAQKETGVLAWFKGLFSGMIKVQSAPSANGTSQSDVLARAKTKLDQGDFSGGLDEVATIPAPPQLVSEWLSAGRKRLALESGISAVRGAVSRATIAPPSSIIPAIGTPPVVVPVSPPVSVPPATVPSVTVPSINQGPNR